MENKVSNKIRLLLNELAILNQPEMHEGKFIYQLDTLKRVKQLSAELYLLADQSLFVNKDSAPVFPEPEKDIPSMPANPEPQFISENPISAGETVPAEFANEEPVVPIPETKEVEPEPLPPPLETPEVVPAKEVSTNHQTGSEIASKISLTRRFEYINNLFAGDSEAFAMFLKQFSGHNNYESAFAFFEQTADEKNWKRKAESASDLKQLLKKLQ